MSHFGDTVSTVPNPTRRPDFTNPFATAWMVMSCMAPENLRWRLVNRTASTKKGDAPRAVRIEKRYLPWGSKSPKVDHICRLCVYIFVQIYTWSPKTTHSD